MRFVDNVREAWKWISMWCMGLSSAFLAAWALLPEDLKPYLLGSIPPKGMAISVASLLVIGMAGRLVKQGDS